MLLIPNMFGIALFFYDFAKKGDVKVITNL